MTTPWMTVDNGPNVMRIMMSLFEEYRRGNGRHNSVKFWASEVDGERRISIYEVYIDSVSRRSFTESPEELILYGWDRGCALKIEYNTRTRTGRIAKMCDLPDEKWPDGVTQI